MDSLISVKLACDSFQWPVMSTEHSWLRVSVSHGVPKIEIVGAYTPARQDQSINRQPPTIRKPAYELHSLAT